MRNFLVILIIGWCSCQESKPDATSPAQTLLDSHPHGLPSAEPILLRASGACLAKITKLEEFDERPSDGDHYVKAWLGVQESTGYVPEFLYLVIDYGGNMPVEAYQELQARESSMVLRHDSLQVGELHWFVFSEDYDSSKYPYQVAGWWRDRDGDVPADVIEAVQNDRFANHQTYDKQLNLVSTWTQNGDEIHIQVRQPDSLDDDAILFKKTLNGTMESLRLSPSAIGYEMEWPPGIDSQFVEVTTIEELTTDNQFDLPAGKYRVRHAYELDSGKNAAIWVAKNQEIWLMQAFHQYDLKTGQPQIVMDFDLLSSGGIAAGSDTEAWYRRIVKKFEDGEQVSTEVFRHEYIKRGTEPIYSSTGWVPVSEKDK